MSVTAPFWAAVAAACGAAVWIGHGRPVLFVQERVGKGGRRFGVFKLRTMTTDADVAARRVTRVGAVLRARGLDEIPQLWNVVRGEMSLVGPRPMSVADTERLCAAHPAFADRFAVPPGITGLVQVTQCRGVEYTARLDAFYVATWSGRNDIAILARTLWINVVGKSRGAMPPPC